MVSRHAWTKNPKAQVKLAKAGQITFSHPHGTPVELEIVRLSFWRRKIIATLTEDIWYRDACGTARLKKGFEYDAASIPNCLWWFIDPLELIYESAFHDDGYQHQLLSKDYVDFQFLYLMKARGKPWWIRYPAYLAVVFFGGKAWRQHAEA